MNETEKQIARSKRMDKIKEDYYKERNELESQMYGKISRDKKAEERLRKKCEEIIYERLEKEHTCDCCRVEYPGVWLGEDGLIHCRIDADHPNDIIDWEENIDDLLKDNQ